MSDRVYLRALEREDSVLFHQWRTDDSLIKLLSGNYFFVSKERERLSIESKILNDSINLYLGVCLKSNDKLIGFVSINNIDLRNLKVEWGGTLIGDKEYLGKGYGEDASRLLLRFVFDQYPINKCYAYCLKEHKPTISLFEKLGFRNDGVLRSEIYKDGAFKDLLLFSILREEILGKF